MPVTFRPRRLLSAALPALLAVALTACSHAEYPNSVFTRHTDFNRDVGYLFDVLFWLGGFVFLFVEGILLWTMWRFRQRGPDDRPEHVHGNTTLEILWTAIPALILAFIAVPTVRTIFKTQAVAKADALQVEVIGHQWWWEFRYPQYKIVTANELYLPVGRTVNFTLKSNDVLHSFWIPQLGGKRDLITNHPNYLWFTPDSTGEQAWNGMCVEYCGTSHANMRFKTFTVTPANFEAWVAHQQTPAAFGAVAAAPPTAAGATPATADSTAGKATGGAPAVAASQLASAAKAVAASGSHRPPPPATLPTAITPPSTSPGPATSVQQAGFIAFPRDKLPAYVIPKTPIPDVAFNDALKGDPQRGLDAISKGVGTCIACHTVNGNPMMQAVVGPNLTHIASRTTIAGGLYPNDTKYLVRWVKNARWMKPGVTMPTLGKGQYDEVTKTFVPASGLTDEQIADIVAYLQALK